MSKFAKKDRVVRVLWCTLSKTGEPHLWVRSKKSSFKTIKSLNADFRYGWDFYRAPGNVGVMSSWIYINNKILGHRSTFSSNPGFKKRIALKTYFIAHIKLLYASYFFSAHYVHCTHFFLQNSFIKNLKFLINIRHTGNIFLAIFNWNLKVWKKNCQSFIFFHFRN